MKMVDLQCLLGSRGWSKVAINSHEEAAVKVSGDDGRSLAASCCRFFRCFFGADEDRGDGGTSQATIQQHWMVVEGLFLVVVVVKSMVDVRVRGWLPSVLSSVFEWISMRWRVGMVLVA